MCMHNAMFLFYFCLTGLDNAYQEVCTEKQRTNKPTAGNKETTGTNRIIE